MKFVIPIFTSKVKNLLHFMEYNEKEADFRFSQYYKLKQDCIGEIYDLKHGLNEIKIQKEINETFDFI